MKLVKIKDEKTLLRDESNKAILVTDASSLQQYKASRNMKLKALEEQQHIAAEQVVIKKELSDIKDLLAQLMEKLK